MALANKSLSASLRTASRCAVRYYSLYKVTVKSDKWNQLQFAFCSARLHSAASLQANWLCQSTTQWMSHSAYILESQFLSKQASGTRTEVVHHPRPTISQVLITKTRNRLTSSLPVLDTHASMEDSILEHFKFLIPICMFVCAMLPLQNCQSLLIFATAMS